MQFMLTFQDFFPVEFPDKTKFKLNINDGNQINKAWDYLIHGEEDPKWISMNAFKTKQPNNNLNRADYLLAFAQYYPYGPNYYIFGGMYKVEKIVPEVYDTTGYKLMLLPNFADYRKRLIIRLEKPISRDTYNRRYINVKRDLNP